MAPGKPPTSSSVGKSNANSLSSPVSLLWAHQLRREHSALLGRVEGLARAVSNVSSAQLNKIAAQVAKAERKSSNVESEQAKLKKELDRACERERRIEEGLTRLSDRLEVSAESIPALHENFRTIQDRVEKDLINRLAFVEHKLQKDAEERERQVQELKAEVRDIQSWSTDIVKEGVIGVRDSMEEVGEQMNQIAKGKLHPAICERDIDALHASCIIHANSEDTQTLQPNLRTQPDLYALSDIEVDKDMGAPEPGADKQPQTPPGETMVMLPENLTSNFRQYQNTGSLKQGKFQSWDRYLTAGEALFATLPRRKEGAFVEAFVGGIYDETLRTKCELTLDERGWSWEAAKDYVMKSVNLETQARERTESLTHKHRKGEVCPVCPKKVIVPESGHVANSVVDGPPSKTFQQSAQRPQIADPERRGQRIHQQNRTGRVRATEIVETEIAKTRSAEFVDKSEVLTKYTSMQKTVPKEAQTNIKTIKEKSAAPEPGAATLNVVEEKKKALFGKTEPPSGSRFQSITPVDYINYRKSPAIRKTYANTTTGTREVSEEESSQKRKLAEYLEISKTTKRDLVTPLNRRIKPSNPSEPEQKKRRKKRAVAPIPMIPILPLSDDE